LLKAAKPLFSIVKKIEMSKKNIQNKIKCNICGSIFSKLGNINKHTNILGLKNKNECI